MCIVYQAWDTRLQRYVAVKRLEPPLNEDPRTRARFDREGRALAQLSHPNLVTLIDRGSTEDEDYLVFEYVEGRSLKEVCREGPLSPAEAGRIAGQVAEGLAVAHLAGIVHRDVKPQNVLIDREGHAKVGDFGIATGPDWTRVTRAGSIVGSARYMSPEQVRSKPVDGRSDVYSLGVVLYEMLAGHPPFDGTNMPEIARQHLAAVPPPLSESRDDLPPGLERVVMRCLEKLPEDRFASMDELLGALVGLGLYVPQRAPEIASGHRRLLRRREEQATGETPGAATGAVPTTGNTARSRDRGRKKTPPPALGSDSRSSGRRAHRRDRPRGDAVRQRSATPRGQDDRPSSTTRDKRRVSDGRGLPGPFFRQRGSRARPDAEGGQEGGNHIIHVTATRSPIPVTVTKLQDVDPQGDAKENHAQLPT